MASNNDGTESR